MNLLFAIFLSSSLLFLSKLLLLFLTEADLLPGVCGQQEGHQGHGGEEHTREEEVESVKQGPPP